ncbi:MAG: phage tail protein [Pseudomonadota bacterium]
MSQFDPVIGADKSGLAYRQDDNNGKKALLSHHKGSTPPVYAAAGTLWLDDSATPWILKIYDGSHWIPTGAVNANSDQYTPYFEGAVLQLASENTAGLARRASDAEVDAGLEDTAFITAKQFADHLPVGVGAPPGLIGMCAMDTPPEGWLVRDGAEISRTVYADLFAAIGTVFGDGDGSTTFNLPDDQGLFERAWDAGGAVDSGRVFGSYQADELKSHRHSFAVADSGINRGNTNATGDSESGTKYTNYTGGSETRPKNRAYLAIIKY